MSPVDVLTMVKNLERRMSAVEQILPTLASKDDVAALRSRTEVLVESIRDDIRQVAEGVATLTERLQRKRLI